MKNRIICVLFCLILLIPITSTIAAANQPPTAPDIEGSPSGKAGVQYTFGFCSTDPDGDNITICVNWGEGSGDEYFGPFPSGVCGIGTHTWSKQGTYSIKAKALDGQAESEWSTLEVTMPTSKIVHTLFIQGLFERLSNAFSILRLRLKS
jgi:hypothetical protein